MFSNLFELESETKAINDNIFFLFFFESFTLFVLLVSFHVYCSVWANRTNIFAAATTNTDVRGDEWPSPAR